VPRSVLTVPQLLAAEVAAVTGPLCGRSCDHHAYPGRDGQTPVPLVCARAAGHTGATLLTDVHVGYTATGQLLTFDELCCRAGGESDG